MPRIRACAQIAETPRRPLAPALMLAVLAAFGGAPAHADVYQFATFSPTAESTGPLSFTNAGGVVGSLSYNASVHVRFQFAGATGLGTQDREAIVTLAAGSAAITPATSFSGQLNQPIGNSSTIRFTGVNGADAGLNLLTLTFTGNLTGGVGASTGSLSGDTAKGNTVTYSSDYMGFGSQGNYALDLPSITPTLSIGAGGFLNSFRSNVSGRFTGDVTRVVPEPASAFLLGAGLAPIAVLAYRRRR
ncbi:MAG: PEP-CTERM sorting domain-containing protein [Isosphaeraceae bacterium]